MNISTRSKNSYQIEIMKLILTPGLAKYSNDIIPCVYGWKRENQSLSYLKACNIRQKRYPCWPGWSRILNPEFRIQNPELRIQYPVTSNQYPVSSIQNVPECKADASVSVSAFQRFIVSSFQRFSVSALHPFLSSVFVSDDNNSDIFSTPFILINLRC